jgi:hypothetical protein
MSRSLSFPMWGPAAVIAAGAALTAACAPPVGDFAIPPVFTDSISIQVANCQTDYISIIVHPSTAHVQRNRDLRWTTPPPPTGVDSVAIEAVHADHWPFPWETVQTRRGQRLPQPVPRRSAAGGNPINAGTVPGTVRPGTQYSYRILLYCGDRVIDLDPDFIVF